MILFYLLAALLIIAVLGMFLPVFARRGGSDVDRTALNIDIAKAKAAELQERLDAGELNDADYREEKKRLEILLARDLQTRDLQTRDLQTKDEESSAESGSTSGHWMIWPVIALVPVAAGLLYIQLGEPDAINQTDVSPVATMPAPQTTPLSSDQASQGTQSKPPTMEEVVATIKARTEEDPDDAEAWHMLGIAYINTGQYAGGIDAMRRSLEIDDANNEVRLRLADQLAAQNGSFAGEPIELLERVLSDVPNMPYALVLYGLAMEQAGDHQQAVVNWQKALPFYRDNEQVTAEINAQIERASKHTGVVPNPDTSVADGQSTNDAAQLTVVVDINTALTDGLPPETAVFIYAKAANGPPMPLAVAKHSLSELPITVTLTDRQAMIDSMKLSAFDQVIVGARVATTGDPVAQSGDLYFETGAVETRRQSGPVRITISKTVP